MIRLYIDNALADLDKGTQITMNYQQEDLSNPTIVKNSFSQQISLPATPWNNIIFDHILELTHQDRHDAQIFSANRRTSFLLLEDDGRCIERGYLKLDSIDVAKGVKTYKVTLYGGLGDLLYQLSYDDDGNKLSLASLEYTDDDVSKMSFKINQTAVMNAWGELGDEENEEPWNIINFAPCYNGIPTDNFSANKGLVYVDSNVYGFENDVTEDGKRYGTYHNDGTFAHGAGYVLADLGEDMSEWQVKDLRSYLQRPVIKVSKMFQAMQDFATAHGKSLILDNSFFNSSNPYYSKAWLALPMLSAKELKAESSSIQGSLQSGWADEVAFEHSILVQSGQGKDMHLELTFTPRAKAQTTGYSPMTLFDPLTRYASSAVFYQLYARDANGALVGASDIVPVVGTGELLTAEDIQNNNKIQGINVGKVVTDLATAVVGRFNWASYDGNYNYYSFSAPVTLMLEATNVSQVFLHVVQVNGYGITSHQIRRALYLGGSSYDTEKDELSTSCSGTLSTFSIIRSGADITKETLLGSTKTPADYLVSYAKKFGLIIDYRKDEDATYILTRDSFYGSIDDAVNIEDRIVRDEQIKIMPFVFDSKYYTMTEETEGSYAEDYSNRIGLPYAQARINTDYAFNADSKELLENYVYKGCAQVLQRDTMFLIMMQGGKYVTPPQTRGAVEYSLYEEGANASQKTMEASTPTSTAVGTYLNPIYKCYDAWTKPQMHTDNTPTEESDVLLFFNGVERLPDSPYKDYIVTDDVPAMAVLNGDNFRGNGVPCWILQRNGGRGEQCYIPHFSRLYPDDKVVTHSMDTGLPREMDIPSIQYPKQSVVYEKGWAKYLADRYNENTKVIVCKVYVEGLQLGRQSLSKRYYFDGCLWVLNKIENYEVGGAIAQCEFVKIASVDNYENGQNY